MKIKRYKELVDENEIQFLREDIKEDFNGSPTVTKTTAKYILYFYKIVEDDTLLTIYNFITTNDLKFKIEPHRYTDKKLGIRITLY